MTITPSQLEHDHPSTTTRRYIQQNKEFEELIRFYKEDEVEDHYKKWVYDVALPESNRVHDLPSYIDNNDVNGFLWRVPMEEEENDLAKLVSSSMSKPLKEGEKGVRKKGNKWSTQEHMLFLLGLDKHGKGEWRSISKEFVKTRSPAQVASHAQKYFERHESDRGTRKRSSIHDITHVDNDSLHNLIRQGLIDVPPHRASSAMHP